MFTREFYVFFEIFHFVRIRKFPTTYVVKRLDFFEVSEGRPPTVADQVP